MFGGSKMIRVKNVSKKFIKFQGATIAPNDYFDYAKIYDYVAYTRYVNSGKISCFEVDAPKTVAEPKQETVVETAKVEKVEKATTEGFELFKSAEKSDEVVENTKVEEVATDDDQKDVKTGRGRKKKS